MGRPQLVVGTPGKTATLEVEPGRWRARCKFRDYDGITRDVSRYAASEAKARQALNAAIRERQKTTAVGGMGGDTKITALLDDWLDRTDRSDKAIGTKQQYRKIADRYVRPALGAYRLAEVDVQVADRALRTIYDQHGHAVAKTARTVMSGMFGLAVRMRAMPSNPIHDVEELRARRRPLPRALEPAELEDFTDLLRSNQRALDLDLPDLVDFLTATGARIGEALACRDETLDLDAGTWHIDATVVRIKGQPRGQGLVIQLHPKSGAGDRLLQLPSFAVEMLRRRALEARLRPRSVVFLDDQQLYTRTGVVIAFPSPHAKNLRDPSNTARDLREFRTEAGMDWVKFHTFRKTVATRLDQAGQTPRQGADQLGHAKTSLFQDVYTGRKIANADAAKILDR